MTYGDAEIGVHQHLEVEALLALIPHQHARLQTLPGQGDAVDQAKGVGPGLARLGAQVGRGEAKVQPDAAVAGRPELPFGLRRGLAQKLPARRPREAVLRQGRQGTLRGRRAEDLPATRLACGSRAATLRTPWRERTCRKDQRDASPDRLRSISGRLLAQEEILSTAGLPRHDGGAIEQHLDGLAGDEAGGDAGSVVGELDTRDGEGRGGRDGGRSFKPVDHGEGEK